MVGVVRVVVGRRSVGRPGWVGSVRVLRWRSSHRSVYGPSWVRSLREGMRELVLGLPVGVHVREGRIDVGGSGERKSSGGRSGSRQELLVDGLEAGEDQGSYESETKSKRVGLAKRSSITKERRRETDEP